ncbi:MAG TPA: thioredoxin domain-containing protein [Pyrinomonadaceae bacterium]|nr:thioredoxin domain-containing protein [Pyrinomonadaceae bacterium]
MNNENKSNSSLPLVIIGLVLLVAVAGGWYFYQNSKSAPVKTSSGNANRKKDDTSALQTYLNAPPGASPANMLGSPAATVTVEEFADFQCPTCAVVHTKMKEITSIYGNRIKFIYRSFPLTQIHKNAYDAAVSAEAAGIQGKYWDMQNQLFGNQQAWSNSSEARKLFSEYAQKIGLDVNKFETDMLGLAAKSRVDLDIARGRSLGITGTPTIFINGRPLPFEQFDVAPMRRVIDAELQRAQSGATQPNTQNQTNAAKTTPATNSNVAVVVPSNTNASNK